MLGVLTLGTIGVVLLATAFAPNPDPREVLGRILTGGSLIPGRTNLSPEELAAAQGTTYSGVGFATDAETGAEIAGSDIDAVIARLREQARTRTTGAITTRNGRTIE